MDVEVGLCANGAGGVRDVARSCSRVVAFSAVDGEISLWIHGSAVRREQLRQETNAVHGDWCRDAGYFKECWGEIHEVHEVVHGASRLDVAGPAYNQGRVATEVVKLCLAVGKTWGSVVTGEGKDGVLGAASLFQLLRKNSNHQIERLHFPEIIGYIGAYFRHIREVSGEFSFQGIRSDSPECFPGAGRVWPVGVNRPKYEKEGFVGGARIEDPNDTLPSLGNDGIPALFTLLWRFAFGDMEPVSQVTLDAFGGRGRQIR